MEATHARTTKKRKPSSQPTGPNADGFYLDIPPQIREWLIREYEVDPTSEVLKMELFDQYGKFSQRVGHTPKEVNVFGKYLKSVFPAIRNRRLGPNRAQKPYYQGIRPKRTDVPFSCVPTDMPSQPTARAVLPQTTGLPYETSPKRRRVDRTQAPQPQITNHNSNYYATRAPSYRRTVEEEEYETPYHEWSEPQSLNYTPAAIAGQPEMVYHRVVGTRYYPIRMGPVVPASDRAETDRSGIRRKTAGTEPPPIPDSNENDVKILIDFVSDFKMIALHVRKDERMFQIAAHQLSVLETKKQLPESSPNDVHFTDLVPPPAHNIAALNVYNRERCRINDRRGSYARRLSRQNLDLSQTSDIFTYTGRFCSLFWRFIPLSNGIENQTAQMDFCQGGYQYTTAMSLTFTLTTFCGAMACMHFERAGKMFEQCIYKIAHMDPSQYDWDYALALIILACSAPDFYDTETSKLLQQNYAKKAMMVCNTINNTPNKHRDLEVPSNSSFFSSFNPRLILSKPTN
eukprot:TRINITY_DN1585_c0_g2_i9.p1 TRINITY_DN1585_c0_g2~~TRINITY_DN1585_c0_g2_i9.p1  ORF type:complete len:515 (+),score=48.50 TRINITY_DN1585_c0_g2_i9:389-1933(+)